MRLDPLPWLIGLAVLLMLLPLVIVYRVQDRVDLAKFQRNTIACTRLGGAAIKQRCHLGKANIPLDAAYELYQLNTLLEQENDRK